jgi:cytochrome P450
MIYTTVMHVAGFLIPAGWKVFPIISAPNFDANLHENPFEFNPWRWFVRINFFIYFSL